MQPPVISIITVVLNRVQEIEYTLSSICEQTFLDKEYIVIDGGSEDGTLSKIEEYKSCIDVLVSEKDRGIYHAMNKALAMAQGEYVLFINGGDSLHDEKTLENIFQPNIIKTKPDIIYGECMIIDRDRKKIETRSQLTQRPLPEKPNLYSFKKGTNISHQSFIVKRDITQNFQETYKWASDIDWMLHSMARSKSSYLYPGIISNFVQGDSSSQHKLTSLRERFWIMRKHYGLLRTLYYHVMILVRRIV